jgi:hypothetical protein
METYWERLEKRFGRRVEEARPAVERFLATHPKEDFYPVTFEDPDSDLELTCLVKLSDGELERLKALSEEFDDPWKEYPELMGRLLDEEVPPIPTSICWEVKSIGLSPEHSYLFTMAVFKDGPDKSPETKRFYIQLADEEYTAILAWSFIHDKNGDGKISFNIMRQDLPELFDKISTALELTYFDCLFRLMDCPYAVFMDEADQDLAMIKKGI